MMNDPDFAPSVGRLTMPKNLRDDVDDLSEIRIGSDLDLHIARLLALHPTLNVRFREDELAALDEATKRSLLNDINRALGIRALRR